MPTQISLSNKVQVTTPDQEQSLTKFKQEAALLAGWEVRRCSNVPKSFYYNPATGQRRWEEDLFSTTSAPSSQSSPSSVTHKTDTGSSPPQLSSSPAAPSPQRVTSTITRWNGVPNPEQVAARRRDIQQHDSQARTLFSSSTSQADHDMPAPLGHSTSVGVNTPPRQHSTPPESTKLVDLTGPRLVSTLITNDQWRQMIDLPAINRSAVVPLTEEEEEAQDGRGLK